MSRRPQLVLLVFAGVTFLAIACLTWFVADVRYEIALPRCATGGRVSRCGGHGWHDVSLPVSSLLVLPMLGLLLGIYLVSSSRLVRAVKADRRDERRSELRRRFGLVLLATAIVTVPLAMAARSAL